MRDPVTKPYANTTRPTLPAEVSSPSGVYFRFNANGSLKRAGIDETVFNLFPGNELEGGPANLYLRLHGEPVLVAPLLGPASPARFGIDAEGRFVATGTWQGLRFRLILVLAADRPAWFWHLALHNTGPRPLTVDAILAQDIALAPYGTLRLNEHYVSHYVDHAPLDHAERGTVLAARQNLAAGGRHPWLMLGSLRRAVAYATDALDVYGLAARAALPWPGLAQGLPGRRKQAEHALAALQDAPLTLAAGEQASLGFYAWFEADHPTATGPGDLNKVAAALALPEARPPHPAPLDAVAPAATLFATSPALPARDLTEPELRALFGAERRHEERTGAALWSFFAGRDRHVVLRAKELAVLRPHGHLLRTGTALAPDETALTSTAWMDGVFHSMLTQGHVSINRMLSTQHGYLGLFRSFGQRVFVDIAGAWHLLDLPSAFEMTPTGCRWIYRHDAALIEVRSEAHSAPHELGLNIAVTAGGPLRFLVCHHVALNGDDGNTTGAVVRKADTTGVLVRPAPGTELARRFADGGLHIAAAGDTRWEHVSGDELLFADGRSRDLPYVCLLTGAVEQFALRLTASLIAQTPDRPAPVDQVDATPRPLRLVAPATSPLAGAVGQLADILPWFTHDALVHFLSPRGLEQYSGGGWGTRDVCQGPVELLLALGQPAPMRDMLLRVFRAQNPDGDWPQWFMFFERDRHIRAGDAHGDIVFWPLLALAQYLIATEDARLLDEPLPFHAAAGAPAEAATLWEHAERALALIGRRVVAGTGLAAYGHGDWNDALQPADPAMREHMCSAWTVTLHKQVLATLATALHAIGHDARAAQLADAATAVQREFAARLVVDGVIPGYALFGQDRPVEYLLHPSDDRTGVRYSVLAMIHAITNDMLSPAQARTHLALIETHLRGPDGVRLFDRCMPYQGGPQRLFQRAESSSYFGREIGLMYMHAHLRYAEALAHVGDASGFFDALCLANPIGIRDRVASAAPRQANCYYSSSDADFADRYEAQAHYDRIARGEVKLEGGWRVYSSGAGIAASLIVRCLLGLREEGADLVLDPVLPPALDGLRVETTLAGRAVTVVYKVGARGCGVTGLDISGKALAFGRVTNPYRVGAARLPRAALAARLAPGCVLTISLG